MATINTNKTLSAVNGAIRVSGSSGASVEMTGYDMIQDTQLIGTTPELLTWGEISGVPEEVQIVNTDDTHYVDLALDSGGTQIFAHLKPGRSYQGPPKVAGMYAASETGTVRVTKIAVQT